MRKRVQIGLAVLLVGSSALCVWHVSRSPGRILSPDVVKLSDGRTLKLERYEFQAKSVRYDLPNRPVARVLNKALPGFLTRRAKWLQPGM
ncbi:MAG TPA: hypothetical protein VNZ64_16705 [Candidatus Acidoferrum sp.]|jgi:hypothetical protein|nr:hypothetical protein [Candidatus Acidoferrum sp.]